jgi:hypothetical protein
MAFLDGELSNSDAQTISAHLDSCTECANLAERFRATSRSLSSWIVPDAPQKLDEIVSSTAAKTSAQRNSKKPLRYTDLGIWNWKMWSAGAGGAVTVVLLLVAFVAVSMYREDHPAPRPPMYSMQENKAEVGGYVQPHATDKLMAPGKYQSAMTAAKGSLAPNSESAAVSRPESQPAPTPMIARTVALTVLVKDLKFAHASSEAIFVQHRGYAAQLTMNLLDDSPPRGFQASLRVPASELAATLAQLRALGRVQRESQSGEEVTQQHADLVARLQNSREEEERLRAILQQRTGKIEDVLQVEEEIERVRGEIESREAEQKMLEHRVDFVTIDLELVEEYKAPFDSPAVSVSTRMHNALVAGLHNASSTLLGIVLLIEEYGPVLLIWLLILGVPFTLLWRRFRRNRSLL